MGGCSVCRCTGFKAIVPPVAYTGALRTDGLVREVVNCPSKLGAWKAAEEYVAMEAKARAEAKAKAAGKPRYCTQCGTPLPASGQCSCDDAAQLRRQQTETPQSVRARERRQGGK